MLEILKDHPNLSMLIILLMGVGGALLLYGYLVSLIYAFGDSIKWGIGVLIIPFFCYYYCLKKWDKASYPGKFLIWGGVLFFPPYIYAATLFFGEIT